MRGCFLVREGGDQIWMAIYQIGEDETGCVVSRVRESIEENHALFIVEIPKTKKPEPSRIRGQ